jgi:hypothetical protein
MPAPIDLTKRNLEGWKALHLDEERTLEKGKRYWVCECKSCGRIKSVLAGNLLTGKSKSCNCMQGRASRQNSPFMNEGAQRAHDEYRIIERGGKRLYSPRAAAEHMDQSQTSAAVG